MIDLSSLKAPGWQRVVAELNAPAPDDRVYYERLLRVLAQVSAARQAVLYFPDKIDGEDVEPRVDLVWPPTELDADAQLAADSAAPAASGSGAAAQVLYANESRTAARAAFGTRQARAFGLDNKEPLYYGEGANAAQQGFILCVPMMPAAQPGGRSRAPQVGSDGLEVPVAVAAMLIEPRSKDAIRSTLAMAEVLAGYVSGHQARQALRQTQQSSFALDLAARLMASINTAPNFKGACIQLTNDLAKQFAVDRVSLGWVHDDRSRVQAISDIEHFDRRTAMVMKLAEAMDECLDQEQPVLFPQPRADGPNADVLLSQAIVHAHRELASGNAKLKVCSFPLRVDDDVVGVLTIEDAGDGQIDLATIELLQSAMDLVAPVLRIRRSDDRILPLRAWDSTVKAGAWLVGPKQTVWKLVGVLALVAFITLAVVRTTYRPSAEAVLEPRVRRLVSAPFDGLIKRLGPGIDVGKAVKENDLLVELDTTEYELGLADALGKIEQAHTQASAARKAKDQAKVVQAEEQEKRAKSEADIYRYRITKSKILAPIDGVIIAGELHDKVGASVKVGDLLLQVAHPDDIIVTARVDERDIALVRKAFEAGNAKGEVATKGSPEDPIPFTIDRIVPLAQATEGKNIFEVRGTLHPSPEQLAKLRPGIEALAKIDTERATLLWIASRRIVDQVRLWLWW
jgi:hypothetical protein